jgi:dTDP-4-amino-4,6-dideoxygalactose transaminase/predicted dehydrogenase
MPTIFQRGVRKLKRLYLAKTALLRAPVRVALVGFGEIAVDHLAAYEDTGAAQVVAVSDLRPDALAKALDQRPGLRAYRNYAQMLREVKPDAISVCTWPDSHAEIVGAATRRGVKGILCEKPLALQVGEMEEMLAACERAGARLACGHQWRFHPDYVRARGIIRGGGLGKVTLVRGNIKSTLANNGPHLVDTVRFLLGDPAARRAVCRCERGRGEFNRGYPAEDSARGEILFEGDVRFEFQTGDLSPTFFTIVVEGSAGTLEVTPASLKVRGAVQPGSEAGRARVRVRQFGEFIEWVKGKRHDYAADGQTSARTAELVLALYEAARLGRPLDLPLRNRGDVIRQLYPTTSDQAQAESSAPEETAALAGPGGVPLALDGGPRAVRGWFSTDPDIGIAELVGVTNVLRSRQLNCTDGNAVSALAREVARAYDAPWAVCSSSGTAALHVAVGSLNPNPGDEIITTPLTDMGSVIPILAANCLPVFADVDPATGNLTADTIARRLSPRTRAVILVHLFGRPADLGPICALLRERGVCLIEDCSQAHFAEYQGKKVGTFGEFGCFSLQQSKQITCGDGGITLVNRPEYVQRASLFVDKGWDRKHGLRAHRFLGLNYRMTELQGAVARAQMRKLPKLIRARRDGAAALTELLRQTPGIVPPSEPAGTASAWWTYPFAIDEEVLGCGTAEFGGALRVEGVRVRHEYIPTPVFEYEVLRNHRTYGDSGYPYTAFPYEEPRRAEFPGLQAFSKGLLYMSWSHNVRPHHVQAIAAAVRKVAGAMGARSGAGRTRPQALAVGTV